MRGYGLSNILHIVINFPEDRVVREGGREGGNDSETQSILKVNHIYTCVTQYRSPVSECFVYNHVYACPGLHVYMLRTLCVYNNRQ